MSAVVNPVEIPFAAKLHVPSAALQPWPLPRDLLIAGEPDASGCILSQSADGSTVRGIWACTPGSFRWDWTCDETVTVILGHASVHLSDGRVVELAPGDMAFFETGLSSTWTIHELFRKSFHTLARTQA
jgi:uncharacterized cupin superfamily protein